MKTRFFSLIIICVVFFASFSFVYTIMHDCLNPPIWMKIPKSDFNYCWGLFVNGHLPDYSDAKENYENKQFQNIMRKKATLAFNILLDKYHYSVDTLTVQDGYRIDNDHEFYIGYAITTNGTDYFLTTMFEPEQSMDTIDVQIFKIISDGCTVHNVLNSSGCDPKYLTDAVKDIPQGVWRG